MHLSFFNLVLLKQPFKRCWLRTVDVAVISELSTEHWTDGNWEGSNRAITEIMYEGCKCSVAPATLTSICKIFIMTP